MMRLCVLAFALATTGCCGPDLVPAIRLADQALKIDAEVFGSEELMSQDEIIKDRLKTIAEVRAALSEVLKREG